MATDNSTTSNDLSHMTWFSVLAGTLTGAISGACIFVPIVMISILLDESLGDIFFMLALGVWIPSGFSGAVGSFLGSTIGLVSGQRKYALLTGLFSGAIIGPISLSIAFNSYWLSPWGIAHSAACGLAGVLGSHFSMTKVTVYHKRYRSVFLIVLLAAAITTLSLLYVRPPDCQRLCGEAPCPVGACLAGEQKAGFPLPVLQDNMTGSSPISGWGKIGSEDLAYPGFFVLDTAFWSIILWVLWKAWLWIMPHVHQQPNGQQKQA